MMAFLLDIITFLQISFGLTINVLLYKQEVPQYQAVRDSLELLETCYFFSAKSLSSLASTCSSF
ncbi:hypothetical protein FM961_03755 [Francisella tularensis]|nr:hypothetical protein [Francisella tularensis]